MRDFIQKRAYSVRNSNVIFVCGGKPNEVNMRTQFQKYAIENLDDFRVFFPEIALETDLTDDGLQYIELDVFEKLVASLSCCVLLFPESPGSYAELGYFSAVDDIRKKLFVVLNDSFDGEDSFISLGPVDKANRDSKFKPVMSVNYCPPDFSPVAARIEKRVKLGSHHRKLEKRLWGEYSNFQKLMIIHWLVDVCRLSNVESLHFLLKSFSMRPKRSEIADICMIMVGSGEFLRTGDEGWLRLSKGSSPFIVAKSGNDGEILDLRGEISSIYLNDDDFYASIKEAYR